MLKKAVLLLAGVLVLVLAATAARAGTLDQIKKRGFLTCGSKLLVGTAEAAAHREADFERLRIEHRFAGGYTVVKDYVRIARSRPREVFVPLAHPEIDILIQQSPERRNLVETCPTHGRHGQAYQVPAAADPSGCSRVAGSSPQFQSGRKPCTGSPL